LLLNGGVSRHSYPRLQHLRVALAWGWVSEADIAKPLELLDHELAMLWKLSH
jgi:hypothetical protein